MDANISTMTMPKTMPVQNLLRYISFKNPGLIIETIEYVIQKHLLVFIVSKLSAIVRQ